MLKSFAKINLSLEILSKRNDGYHNVDTLMNKIELHDEMEIEKANGEDLFLCSDDKDFPTDETNLIYRAWRILKNYKKYDTGLKIFVKKNIPVAAGLAGGTSNACSVMKYLNEFWKLHLSNEELIEISKPLGADAAFFFHDGLVRARGIGNEIEEIKKMKEYPILIINNGEKILSKDIYKNVREYSSGKVEEIIKNIDDDDFLFKNAFNSMENPCFKLHPELSEIKDRLLKENPASVLMSGSGPTIFSIFYSEFERDLVYNKFFGTYKTVIKSKIIR